MLALLIACTTDPIDTGTSDTDTGEPPLVWPETEESLCDNPASIVQVAALLPEDSPLLTDGAATGDVVIAMMHRRHGNPDVGGHPHWVWRLEDQPLSATDPTFLEVDMCQGNAIMWSEENCEYNLIVMVDDNGNNGLTSANLARPDEGEHAAMEVFNQSCHHEGAYQFELTLDCTEGTDCVTFEAEAECECVTPECPSESGICWL